MTFQHPSDATPSGEIDEEMRERLGGILFRGPLGHLKAIAVMLHEERHKYPDNRFKSGFRGPDFEECHAYVCRRARESLLKLAMMMPPKPATPPFSGDLTLY